MENIPLFGCTSPSSQIVARIQQSNREIYLRIAVLNPGCGTAQFAA
jgi:hypothetical protein